MEPFTTLLLAAFAIGTCIGLLCAICYVAGRHRGYSVGYDDGYTEGVGWGRSAERMRLENEFVHPGEWDPEGEG